MERSSKKSGGKGWQNETIVLAPHSCLFFKWRHKSSFYPGCTWNIIIIIIRRRNVPLKDSICRIYSSVFIMYDTFSTIIHSLFLKFFFWNIMMMMIKKNCALESLSKFLLTKQVVCLQLNYIRVLLQKLCYIRTGKHYIMVVDLSLNPCFDAATRCSFCFNEHIISYNRSYARTLKWTKTKCMKRSSFDMQSSTPGYGPIEQGKFFAGSLKTFNDRKTELVTFSSLNVYVWTWRY